MSPPAEKRRKELGLAQGLPPEALGFQFHKIQPAALLNRAVLQ